MGLCDTNWMLDIAPPMEIKKLLILQLEINALCVNYNWIIVLCWQRV